MHDAHTKYKKRGIYETGGTGVRFTSHLFRRFYVFMSVDDAASLASPPFSPAPLTACIREGRAGSSDHCNTWSISGRIKWATRRKQYVASLNARLNFTQAARAVDVSKRILIADRLKAGDSTRAIALLLDREPPTVSRKIRANHNRVTGEYEPHCAQQTSADRFKRPKTRKA